MGCFLGCFGSSKDRKRRKLRYKVIPRDQNHKIQNLVQADVSLVQSVKERPSNSLSESRGKIEEPLCLNTRKKVTFNTNVTTYEHVQVYDSTESLLEKNEKGETFPKSAQTQFDSGSPDGSEILKAGSYPPNYRYGNCVESDDDEVEDSDYEDEDDDDGLENEEDYDDEDEDRIICREVWCESIPIPSTESRTESSLLDKVGSNSNARDRSAFVVPVLNPVENLTQWKALKSKGTPPVKPFNFNQQKENSSLNSTPFAPQNRNQETAVDASLSNWLVSSEKNTPNNKRVVSNNPEYEPISSGKSLSRGSAIEDRPILGALTEEELKQFSASSCTPRKSPSRNPDEMAIIGSVGSYWSHTDSVKSLSSNSSYKGIPNTTSKYREDKKVNWHNTPFETRLERALERGATEV
ncbi:uncharacterized protein LOC112518376 [Cynara cardunculus var. scolymus]|uniref:uncharacterized protein LOC112518376 n=1 Tax=Cynara cardunculus var. scolymus TaxID=59895 RepID=UPI000D623B67|nr:uncharacterized protein LOC112518376 [Cynara cardunculus var. scolymus]